MLDQYFHRQLGIVHPEKLKIPITIIGAGSVGSFAAICLSKMGCSNISIYDDDIVEAHNMPNQFFKISDIGRPKVEALKDGIRELSGYEINSFCNKFDFKKYGKLTIVAVDNMYTRIDVFNKSLSNIDSDFIIDARMGGEFMRIYAFNSKDRDDRIKYKEMLYTDEEASEEKCTEKTIVYNISIISGIIGNYVKKYVNEELNIPFETQFDCKTLWSCFL